MTVTPNTTDGSRTCSVLGCPGAAVVAEDVVVELPGIHRSWCALVCGRHGVQAAEWAADMCLHFTQDSAAAEPGPAFDEFTRVFEAQFGTARQPQANLGG